LLDEVRPAQSALQEKAGLSPYVAPAAARVFLALSAPAFVVAPCPGCSSPPITPAGTADSDGLCRQCGQCRLIAQPEVLQVLAGEGLENLLKPAVRDDIMRNVLPRLLASRFSRVGRHKPHLHHLVSPLPVVITAPAGLAEILLPEVAHFMHERGVPLDVLTVHEVRVDADFVDNLLRLVLAPPAVGGKKPVSPAVP